MKQEVTHSALSFISLLQLFKTVTRLVPGCALVYLKLSSIVLIRVVSLRARLIAIRITPYVFLRAPLSCVLTDFARKNPHPFPRRYYIAH